jgi:hypothetical protein
MPAVGNLPNLPAIHVRSFAAEKIQPVLDALPTFAPGPTVASTVATAATTVSTAVTGATDAVIPHVQSLEAAMGPVQQLQTAAGSALYEALTPVAEALAPAFINQPPALAPRPRNIVIEPDNVANAPEEASEQAMPDLPPIPPQPAPTADASTASAPEAGLGGERSSFEALHILQSLPAQPQANPPGVTVVETPDTVFIKMPRPDEVLQAQPVPQLPPPLPKSQVSAASRYRKLAQAADANLPAATALAPTPSAVPTLQACPAFCHHPWT